MMWLENYDHAHPLDRYGSALIHLKKSPSPRENSNDEAAFDLRAGDPRQHCPSRDHPRDRSVQGLL
jgi:hypothetical protein